MNCIRIVHRIKGSHFWFNPLRENVIFFAKEMKYRFPPYRREGGGFPRAKVIEKTSS
jgi:hypothetical protein